MPTDGFAELEIAGNYNPAIHDSWFAGFDWQACAFALLLGAPSQGLPLVSRPFVHAEEAAGDESTALSSRTPAMAGLPLLQALRNPVSGRHRLPVTTGDDGWTIELELP